jgi:hypothetical protein
MTEGRMQSLVPTGPAPTPVVPAAGPRLPASGAITKTAKTV